MTEQPHKPGTSHDAPVTAAGRDFVRVWKSLSQVVADPSRLIARIEAEARQASLTTPLAAPADPPATRESAALDVERLERIVTEIGEHLPWLLDRAKGQPNEGKVLADEIAAAYAAATGSTDPVATTDEEGAER